MASFAILLNRFGLEIVGLWVLVTALLNYGQIGDVWSKGLLSFIGQERGRGELSEAAEYASTTITTGAVGYVLAMSIGGAAVYVFAPKLIPPEHVGLVRQNIPLMVAAYSLIASAGNFKLAFVGFGFIWTSALQRIGGALLFLVGVLALDPNLGLTGILTIQLLQGIGMLFFGVIAFYGFIVQDIHHAFWARQKFRQLIGFGSKLLFIGGIERAIEPIIRILVSQFAGLAFVAVMEIVMRLIQGFRGLILSVGQVMITSMARRHNSSRVEDTTPLRDDFVDATQLFLAGALISFSLLFAASPLMSLLFLNADAQAEAGASFQLMLWVFGTGWLINTAGAAGYFVLMALRVSRRLFIAVAIRAGLIAILGIPLGDVFGLGGVMAAVLLATISSSAYSFLSVSKSVKLPLPHGLFDLLLKEPSMFIPFAWANALTIVWIVLPTVSSQPLMLAVYSIGFLFTGLLVMRFGRVQFLFRAVMDLRS